MSAAGYVYCAHALCFAILVGEVGELCDDCRAEDPEHDECECDGCDNDRDVGQRLASRVRAPRSEVRP